MPRKKTPARKPALPPGRLRARYLRLQKAWSLDEQLDDEWCHDSVWDDWDEWNPAGTFDFLFNTALNAVRFSPVSRSLGAELRRARKVPPTHEPPPALDMLAPPSGDELADRLLHHVRAFDRGNHPPDHLPPHPADHDLLATLADRDRRCHHALAVAFLFAPFWIRSPRTWNAPQLAEADPVASLLSHLFVAYPVPPFLLTNWTGDGGRTRLKWICWLILLGQGASLHRVGKRFGWTVPRDFVHLLQRVPAGLSGIEPCVWAHIVRAGGGDIEYRRLRTLPGFAVDLTEPAAPGFREFWNATVRWLATKGRPADGISDPQARVIVEWALHEFIETQRFVLARRTAAGAWHAALSYQRELLKPYVECSWPAHRLNWNAETLEGQPCEAVELTTGRDLFEESQAMHHCVTTYTPRCRRGASAIVSLRVNKIRTLTIEVNPATRGIVQICGPCNRAPTPAELAIIDRWAQAVL